MKSLVINNEILEKYEIDIDDLLWLYKKLISDFTLSFNLHNSIKLIELENKGLIKITNDLDPLTFELRQKGLDLLDLLTIDIDIKDNNEIIHKKSSRLINNEIDVKSFREKWKGLAAGSMGSPKSCKEKLIRWMKENPEYSFDDILKAADVYINSLDNYRYLQRADYFVFKKEGKEESSRLSAFIDEIDEYQKEGWTNNLK